MNTIRLVALWLASPAIALAQAAPEPPPVPLYVGAVISQTGSHAELAADYARGIQLWREQANEQGGLLGRRVELQLLDDASQATRNRELYAQLIKDPKVSLLVGPYGSAATLIASGEVERARRVMVNGSGPASVVHARAPRYLFQTSMPYSVYGAGVLRIAAEAGYKRLFIIARDDAASREMAEGLRAAAGKDFTVAPLEFYRGGLTDFIPQVAKARSAQAEAWIAFADARDAAEMVKTFKRLDFAPPLFYAQGAAQPRFIAALGQDAEWSLGGADFDPRFGGPAARTFTRQYTTRYSTPPTSAAAEGYTAAAVLGAAVRSAGSLQQEALRAALAELEMETPFGDYRVAPENNSQIGYKPIVTQIIKGRPTTVWPPAAPGGARPLLPYPQWDERVPIK